MSHEPPNDVFSAFSITGFILVLIPFYWHAEGGNTGTCLFMFWSALGCFNSFVNSRVWNGNVLNVAPVWCDISTRIIIAINVAIPLSTLCITRRLYLITSDVAPKLNKRREALIDLSIGFGLPILDVILSYIVQGHRANILEDVGCWPATVNTDWSYLILFSWPIIIGFISAYYGMRAMLNFYTRRKELNSMISSGSTHDSFSYQRSLYIRLMVLALVDICLTVPIASYLVYLDRSSPSYYPYASWAWIHADFWRIDQIPAVIWKATTEGVATIELSRWSNVLSAFVFFALFGLAQEAQKNYRIFGGFVKRVGHAATGHRFQKYVSAPACGLRYVMLTAGSSRAHSGPVHPVMFSGATSTAFTNESRMFHSGKKTRGTDSASRISYIDMNVVLDNDAEIGLSPMDKDKYPPSPAHDFGPY
ncbi:STE3-domain-containing protein [Artomyces pyxidatus]|uniref:STE3-domain-containing protein n=1 Tax=Artomyces pyxidatus TaxID=48021 RepID=A0ACB8SIN7_9AGAM|nr:STE3-domain-containing protein [Artomyces pyxidatus]